MANAVLDLIGSPSLVSLGTKNLILGTNGAADLVLITSGTERFRVSSAGVAALSSGVVLGASSRDSTVTAKTGTAVPLYVASDVTTTSPAGFVGYGDAASSVSLEMFKTRASTPAATTIVQSGDVCGTFRCWAANGTTYDPVAQMKVEIDGTPGASADMPGRFVFLTTPDGSATLAESFRINSAQNVVFAAGKNIRMTAGGANATSGTFVCNGATNVVITTSAASATMLLLIGLNTVGGTVGATPKITTITNGVSFTVAGTAGDTSTYNWAILGTA